MFWKRLFSSDPQAAARSEYQQLLAQARKAAMPTDRARLLNLAGDLAIGLNDADGALAAFGEALDVYLRDRDYHSARAIARKLLRFRSDTVRVRSTLAWLAIAQDLPGDARVALDLYVTSLKAEGERTHAIRHLTAMSKATQDEDVRLTIAEHLDSLEADDAAREIRTRLAEEDAGNLAPPTRQAARARWEEALDSLISPSR